MKHNTLIVCETFYSIQGEGQNMGVPAVFLRLGGCNLLCESKHWRCDTIEVWQKGKAIGFEYILTKSSIEALENGAHLVITGGEPLLQQRALVDYLTWFRIEFKFKPIIEIETNGTIVPLDFMIGWVDFWNVSPKLHNSGMSYDVRVNGLAILKIQNEGYNPSFKFVISDQIDAVEIDNDYGFINRKNIILMPAGDTRDKLNIMRPMVVELCKVMGYRYCDRLHIIIWNQKRGCDFIYYSQTIFS